MSASDYLENKVLDHIFGKASYTAPSNLYVALCTEAPTDASTGSTIVEANYTGYARKQTSPSDWDAAASGLTDNANAIAFAACTGGSSDVTHFALVDAAADGNVIFWGALASSLAVSAGITPEFAAGDLDVTCD